MASVQKLIDRMKYWCDVANMGYNQSDRWNFNPAGGNCDCSSLVIHCLQEAGFDTGSAGYTGNLSANLTARGWARLPNNGNPRPGDILLNDAAHVAVYIGGGRLAQASISENGSTAGAPGDQTGGETNTNPYYNFPWDCYLRWTGTNDTDTPTNTIGDETMAIVYGSDQFAGLKYWDGVNPPTGIKSNNHLSTLQQSYKAATGRDLPMLTFNGAWAVVAEQSMVAASQQRDKPIMDRLAQITTKIGQMETKLNQVAHK
ncbi:endolysin-like domain-containing protein [Bifidobacterium aemilianum]|uniref:peptidoglycan amidohydrolase family protein n=1 Tax=Bifidobacterium aemilianum TaxID=2493120 RepID=UPI000DE8DE31|nr:peptidoglycan amidohydrolase family protein [Bifidobacterium aemilianum]